jgi:hypothetical protein
MMRKKKYDIFYILFNQIKMRTAFDRERRRP